jgi:hypothetical protein
MVDAIREPGDREDSYCRLNPSRTSIVAVLGGPMSSEEITPHAYLRVTVRLYEGAERAGSLPWGATCECRIRVSATAQDLGDAAIFFEDRRELSEGDEAQARMLPGHPSRWAVVSVGTEIELLLNGRQIGVATMGEVLERPTEARFSVRHRRTTATRWSEQLNRRMDEPSYREEWRRQQCGLCEYWIPLAGWWGLDWGGCSNAASPFDGSMRFEHDGCDEYREAAEWYGPVEFSEEDFAER